MKTLLKRFGFIVCAIITLLTSCKDFDDNFDPMEYKGEYSVTVDILQDQYVYKHNVIGFVGYIDWGDGTHDTMQKATDLPKHTYKSKGEYKIVCEGMATALCSRDIDTRDIIELHAIGQMGLTSMQAAFFRQTRLKEVPAGIFDNCHEVTDFSWVFSAGVDTNFENMEILHIPEGLFDYCPKVTTFERAFYSCQKLLTIPEGLFDNCPEVTSFNCTFGGCKMMQSIPEGLFDKCTKVTDFGECFMGTASVMNIPEKLFHYCPDVTNFWNIFGWSGITSIPENLFANNPEVTDFSTAFSNCDNVTVIPAGLFRNNTKATNFFETFESCDGIITIPESLFDACTQANNFKDTFKGCKNLETVPAGLFANNAKIDCFLGTFSECTKLQSESPYSTIQVNGVETKVHLYERGDYKDRFTTPLFVTSCFKDCINLTDYKSIPDSWK